MKNLGSRMIVDYFCKIYLISNDPEMRFPFVTRRHVKSYPYHYMSYDGSSKIKIGNLQKPIQFHENSYFPRESSLFFGDKKMYPNAHFVGFTPFHVGYMRGSQYPMNWTFFKYLRSDNPTWDFKQWVTKNILLKGRFMVGGGYNTNIPHIKSYGLKGNVEISGSVFHKMLREIEFDKFFKLPKLPTPTMKDIDYLKVNPDAYSGLMCSKLFGSTRRESLQATIPVAKAYLRVIQTQLIRNVGMWSIGAREKEVNVDHDTITTRLVSMPEQIPLLAWLTYGQSITNALMLFKTNDMFIGRRFDKTNLDYLSSIMKDYKYCISCDFKDFDQSCTRRFIRIACGILRQCFNNDKENDFFFANLCESIITKFYCLPPGMVYRITKGIPSGHAFTSLCGTVINKVVWILALYLTIGMREDFYTVMKVIAGGDDGLIFINDLSIIKDLQRNVERLGFKIKGNMLEDVIPLGSVNFSECPVFFKRRINSFGLCSWDAESIWRRISNPSSKHMKSFDLIEIVDNYLMESSFDPDITLELYKYRDFIIGEQGIAYNVAKHPSYINAMTRKLNDAIKLGVDHQVTPLIDSFSVQTLRKYKPRFPILEVLPIKSIPVRMNYVDILACVMWYSDKRLFKLVEESVLEANSIVKLFDWAVAKHPPPYAIQYLKEGTGYWPYAIKKYSDYQGTSAFVRTGNLGGLSQLANF